MRPPISREKSAPVFLRILVYKVKHNSSSRCPLSIIGSWCTPPGVHHSRVYHLQAITSQICYRGTLLIIIKNTAGSYGGVFLMSEVPLTCIRRISGLQTKRWTTHLSSKVSLPHGIDIRKCTAGTHTRKEHAVFASEDKVCPCGRRHLSVDNLLVRIHLSTEIILVDRPCAMGI